MNISSHPRRQGFTLVEVALAITIVAIVVLAAIGLLLPSQRAIDEVLSGGQATRLRQEIEKEFSVLRPTEKSSFTTPFDKAYNAVKNGAKSTGLLCVFSYRAENGSTLEDGRLKPYTGPIKDKRAGEDYFIQAAAMTAEQFKNSQFKEALEGRLFIVRMLPIEGLVSETQTPPAPLKILPADDPNNPNDTPLKDFLNANGPEAYPLAVIPATAEFYEAINLDDPATLINVIPDPVTKQTPGGAAAIKPIISLNIGFNR